MLCDFMVGLNNNETLNIEVSHCGKCGVSLQPLLCGSCDSPVVFENGTLGTWRMLNCCVSCGDKIEKNIIPIEPQMLCQMKNKPTEPNFIPVAGSGFKPSTIKVKNVKFCGDLPKYDSAPLINLRHDPDDKNCQCHWCYLDTIIKNIQDKKLNGEL